MFQDLVIGKKNIIRGLAGSWRDGGNHNQDTRKCFLTDNSQIVDGDILISLKAPLLQACFTALLSCSENEIILPISIRHFK